MSESEWAQLRTYVDTCGLSHDEIIRAIEIYEVLRAKINKPMQEQHTEQMSFPFPADQAMPPESIL